MNELANLIAKKTGIPQATALMAVQVMVNYLKSKLPAPIAAEVTSLLSNDANVQEAEQLIGGLAAEISKASKKK